MRFKLLSVERAVEGRGGFKPNYLANCSALIYTGGAPCRVTYQRSYTPKSGAKAGTEVKEKKLLGVVQGEATIHIERIIVGQNEGGPWAVCDFEIPNATMRALAWEAIGILDAQAVEAAAAARPVKPAKNGTPEKPELANTRVL